MYMKVGVAIDRRRPEADELAPWPALSVEQRREMDQAVAMLREAADQGHVMAQVCIGDLCTLGHGVARDGRLASM